VSANIYDALGKWVKTIEFSTNFSNFIDVSDLKLGVYFLEIETLGKDRVVKSFIKN